MANQSHHDWLTSGKDALPPWQWWNKACRTSTAQCKMQSSMQRHKQELGHGMWELFSNAENWCNCCMNVIGTSWTSWESANCVGNKLDISPFHVQKGGDSSCRLEARQQPDNHCPISHKPRKDHNHPNICSNWRRRWHSQRYLLQPLSQNIRWNPPPWHCPAYLRP